MITKIIDYIEETYPTLFDGTPNNADDKEILELPKEMYDWYVKDCESLWETMNKGVKCPPIRLRGYLIKRL